MTTTVHTILHDVLDHLLDSIGQGYRPDGLLWDEASLQIGEVELRIPREAGGEDFHVRGPLGVLAQMRFIDIAPDAETNAGTLILPRELSAATEVDLSDGLDDLEDRLFEALTEPMGRRDRRDEAEQAAGPTKEEVDELSGLICALFALPGGYEDSISEDLVHIRTYDEEDVILNGHFDIRSLAAILLRDYVKR